MKIFILILPLIFGFVLDWIFGDPYSLPHPIRLIGTMISGLERIIRKIMPQNEKAGGALLAVLVLLISSCVPLLVLIVSYRINVTLGIIIESVFCYYLIAAKCLKNESMKVFKAVQKNDTGEARKAVSMIVGRDTENLDKNGIIKAAVETVAENTSDGVTAPMCYMMIGGAVGGFFYKAANTMDSMIGYKNDKYIDFGFFAARIDDVLNFLPSRITALLMILSAYILKLDGKNAYRIWKRDRRNHASPNSAQTESVCAGALDIMLAGDAWYFGKLHRKKTIGDDIRPIENEDIRRANSLMYCTALLMLVISAAVRYSILLWVVR